MVNVPPAKIPKLQIRVAKYLPVLLIVGLAVHLLLPQITALQHSLSVIRTMARWAVGLAIVAQVVSYLGNGYMLQALVGVTEEHITLLKGTTISVAAASIGLVAGGMVGSAAATYRWMRGNGIGKQGALLAGWLPSFLNNLLLWVAGLAGMIHLLLVHDLTAVQIIGFSFTAALLTVATVIVVWGVEHRPQLVSLAEQLSHLSAKLRRKPYDPNPSQGAAERLFNAWDALVTTGGWRKPLLGAAINVAGDMLTLYFFFLAAGHPVSPGVLLSGYGLPLLLGKAAFFLPGGVGIIEGTMTALYTGLGVPSGVVVVVILAYRVVSFWLPTVMGYPLAARLQRLILHHIEDEPLVAD
ncbi:MAG: YbhN family protein [Anaerolineae bacterium]|nr:YbhN family protein [Anaerolineae bacterium]